MVRAGRAVLRAFRPAWVVEARVKWSVVSAGEVFKFVTLVQPLR